MADKEITDEEILLREYSVCNDKAHSYMTVNWQIGAIFISASILMLGFSVQIYPKTIGALLIPISWITLLTWYLIFKRNQRIYFKAYDRAKAIEEFMKGKHKGIDALKYTNIEKETIETTTINSWIDKVDKISKTPRLGTKYIKIYLGILVLISILLFAFYIWFLIC